MRKLIVYWTLNRMTEARAKGQRKYEVTPMRTDFNASIDPQDAIRSIQDEHGRKPEQPDPSQPALHGAHQFADIRYWLVAEIFERSPEVEEKLVQFNLISEEALKKCAKKL